MVVVVAVVPVAPTSMIVAAVSVSSLDSWEEPAEAAADMLALAFDLAALDRPPLALPAALAFILLSPSLFLKMYICMFPPPVPS